MAYQIHNTNFSLQIINSGGFPKSACVFFKSLKASSLFPRHLFQFQPLFKYFCRGADFQVPLVCCVGMAVLPSNLQGD